MMGFACFSPLLALPCSSGTGGTSLRGWVCVHSGRAMPFFAMWVASINQYGLVCPGRGKEMQECSYEDAMGMVLALLAGAYPEAEKPPPSQ